MKSKKHENGAIGEKLPTQPCDMSLAVALRAVNGLLSEHYCPIDSFKQVARFDLLSPLMGMSKGESLMAELLYLRVETHAIRQKNRRLKRQLFSRFLPRPKRSSPNFTQALRPELEDFTPTATHPSSCIPPVSSDVFNLPPIRLKEGPESGSKNLLPPVNTLLPGSPDIKGKFGCKRPDIGLSAYNRQLKRHRVSW